jgi:hypothetical protein
MEFYWTFIFMTFVLFIIAILSSDTIRDVSVILGLLNILLSLYMKQISLKEHNENPTDKTKKQLYEDATTDIPFVAFKNFGDGVANSTRDYKTMQKFNDVAVTYEPIDKRVPRNKNITDKVAEKKVIGTTILKELEDQKPQYSTRFVEKNELKNFNEVSPLTPSMSSRMDDNDIKKLGGTAATLKVRQLRRGKSTFENEKLRQDKWRNRYNKDYNLQRRTYTPGSLNKFFESELHENERLTWWGNY